MPKTSQNSLDNTKNNFTSDQKISNHLGTQWGLLTSAYKQCRLFEAIWQQITSGTAFTVAACSSSANGGTHSTGTCVATAMGTACCQLWTCGVKTNATKKWVSYQNQFLSYKISHITLSVQVKEGNEKTPHPVQSGGSACTWTCFTALVESILPATAYHQKPILPRKSQQGPSMEIKLNEWRSGHTPPNLFTCGATA